jgi:beta-lactamase class A
MDRKQKIPGKLFRASFSGLVPPWIWAALMGAALAVFLFARPVRTASALALPPVAPAVDEKWAHMVESITGRTSQFDGAVGIYIKDLATGRIYEHNSDQRFLSASLIKLPIMAALFADVEDGRIRLDGSLRYSRKYRREGAGILKWARDGSRFTISSLVHTMISKSDNTATAMIISLMGFDRLNERFNEFGLSQTRILPTGMSLASKLDPALDNWTTPAEMGRILESIYRHKLLKNDGLSDLMIEILKGANSRSRLARDLPSHWQLARKTGLLRKNCHDCGIVFSPDGDYIICVMTGDSHTYADAKGFISDVGKKTYDYFAPNS